MQSPFSYPESYASSYSSSPGGMDFFYGMGAPQAPVYDSSFDLEPASPFVPEVHPEIYSFTSSSPYMYSPPMQVKEFPFKDFQMYEAPPMATSLPSSASSTCDSVGWNIPEEVPSVTSYPTMSMSEDSGPDTPSATKPSKPFACDAASCNKAFTRFADLKRHQSSVHYPVFRNCPVDNCSRKGSNGFPRQDHLVEHLRSYHHLDVPKRRACKRSVKEIS
ncbi:uncharacterized protein N7469_005680 [Penicillium citrinum]|jgi:hypothetical protein|uniref:C2H2-type domain-containing protein n=2 Tax=Penicillium TaxID=5073 RepID=A0A9W9P1S9_PENCI|nr:uncharacterized protein N7469_005680 [Penicillium citrinum]KAJ5233914.1 hypothetical protein N7469_005680 [Penicillium citrinum]KAJ5572608.1 hypothetical protein N7450_009592 [Penicillium hetheringtonii]